MKMCSLFSGSSGNCIYISSEKTNILVDCGVSGKSVAASLAEIGVEKIDAVLVTHEHSDHVKGVGIISRKLMCLYMLIT